LAYFGLLQLRPVPDEGRLETIFRGGAAVSTIVGVVLTHTRAGGKDRLRQLRKEPWGELGYDAWSLPFPVAGISVVILIGGALVVVVGYLVLYFAGKVLP
jgi:hypothetical protein